MRTWTLVGMLFLAACGGGGPSKITVKGKALDNANNPKAGVVVMLGGIVKTTGSDGVFEFADVMPPYTLIAKDSGRIVEFRGLATATPQLGGRITTSAAFSGKVTGPTYPEAPDIRSLIAVSGGAIGSPPTADTSGNFTGAAVWFSGNTATADLSALRIKVAGNSITDYLQTGKHTGVAFSSGVPLTAQDIALGSSPIATTTTKPIYALGAYSASSQGILTSVKASGTVFPILSGLPIMPGIDVKIPTEGAFFSLAAKDADGNSAYVSIAANTAGSTNLILPTAALKNTLPAANSTGAPLKPIFSWTPLPVDAYIVTITPVSPATGNSYVLRLPGSSTSLDFPDYTTLSAGLAPGTKYAWSILGLKMPQAPIASLDDLAQPGLSFIYNVLTGKSLEYYTSKETFFTTAP
jgi:hypothetical protein